MNFMLIRRFFIYFADFRGDFCICDDCFVLLAQSFLAYSDWTLFCELFIALIARERYSALCFLVLLKKLKVFLVFLFNLFLNAVSILHFFCFSGGSGFTMVVLVV